MPPPGPVADITNQSHTLATKPEYSLRLLLTMVTQFLALGS